jgi:protein-disulfide isomerase
MNKIFLTLIAIFAFNSPHHALASADAQGYKEKVKAQVSEYDQYKGKISDFEKTDKFKKDLLYTDQPYEIRFGKPDAPIKLVEYMSLTCSHCKEFHDGVFYNLKRDFIDTGKVYMRVRHFPLNGTAVKAVMILDCVKPDDKLAFMGALFKSQAQWAFVQNESQLIERLKTISKIGGIDEASFETCYGDAKKQDDILAKMKEAAESLMVDSTPALYVNGTRYLGARDYESFKKAIEAMPADTTKAIAEEKKSDAKADKK